MPIPDSFNHIFSRVESLTKQRKLSWVAGPTDWIFLASFEKASLQVEDSGGTPDTEFRFHIINSEGKQIDSFRVVEAESDFKRLSELWWDARRIAHKVEETIASLESELDNIQ